MENPPKEINVPENFISIIKDFTTDLTTTFPEFSFLWSKWVSPELSQQEIIALFEYVLGVFLERFFDILYQNEEIFDVDSKINTFFLPNVNFKVLFHCDGITETTQKAIWNYLQLILFCVLNSVGDKSKFGESTNIFEGIDENILQEKLQDTIRSMSDFFKGFGKNTDNKEGDGEGDGEGEGEGKGVGEGKGEGEGEETAPEGVPLGDEKMNFDFDKMPNPEDLHEHLKGLFDGKIGKLAKELAEEISGDIHQFMDKDEMEKIHTTEDVIKTLMKNPKKMMDLVKSVGSKLNTKMEKGEISQDDIMKEASELFGKMKDMGGTQQFNEMFKNIAKQMAGNGAKVDMNAMNQKMKSNATKEKLRKRLQNKKDPSTANFTPPTNPMADSFSSQMEEIEKLMKNFGLGGAVEPPKATGGKKKKNKK